MIVTNITKPKNVKSSVIDINFLKLYLGLPDSIGRENCLSLRGAHSWTWNDAPCTLNRPFICELHGNAILFELECITFDFYFIFDWWYYK